MPRNPAAQTAFGPMLVAAMERRLVEQLGPEQFVQRYVEPTGRNLTASQVEWSAYANKP
jgi:hypothetical protein